MTARKALVFGLRLGVSLAATVAVVGLVVASGASAAKAHPTVAIRVTVAGNGVVSLPVADARFACHAARTCTHTFHVGLGRRVELSASPHMTWKLTGWGGACKGTAQTCSLGRVEARRSVKVTFVARGTRLNPYPLGTAVGLDPGWKVTVNSAIIDADAQVEAVTDPHGHQSNPPPPGGAQYVLVNLTMKNLGVGGSTSPPLSYAEGKDNFLYSPDSCAPPSPDLGSLVNVGPGQTVTGNTCYQIESTDASTLLLRGLMGVGGSVGEVQVWLALREAGRSLSH